MHLFLQPKKGIRRVVTFNDSNQKIIGHRGRWGGYLTKMQMNPANKRAIIILLNKTST